MSLLSEIIQPRQGVLVRDTAAYITCSQWLQSGVNLAVFCCVCNYNKKINNHHKNDVQGGNFHSY